jgi:NADH-quinone oxidoreductase subunit L
LGLAFARSAMLDRYLALWIVGVITAALTAFYMFRLLFLTFFGHSRLPHELEEHIHESPPTMTIPLAILALLSIIGGWVALPSLWGGESPFEKFLDPVLSGVVPETAAIHFARHTLLKEWLLMGISVVAAVSGILLARHLYLKFPQLHEKVAASFPRLHSLLVHKYYVDEIYDALFVNRIKDLSIALGLLDAKVIDGVGVNGAAWLARAFSSVSMWWDKWVVDGLVNFVGKFVKLLSAPVRMFQTGVFSSYAVFILLGVVILLGYYGYHMEALARSLR